MKIAKVFAHPKILATLQLSYLTVKHSKTLKSDLK